MAFGIGKKSKPMSEVTRYEKLKSLEAKSCLRILGMEHRGPRVEFRCVIRFRLFQRRLGLLLNGLADIGDTSQLGANA